MPPRRPSGPRSSTQSGWAGSAGTASSGPNGHLSESTLWPGGAAAAWPLAARAQQGERMRRIGVLLPAAADDTEWQARVEQHKSRLADR